jgi:Na+-transporting methylmalonyl-CoA/oxaloacetate decarboxylase beta subunit
VDDLSVAQFLHLLADKTMTTALRPILCLTGLGAIIHFGVAAAAPEGIVFIDFVALARYYFSNKKGI